MGLLVFSNNNVKKLILLTTVLTSPDWLIHSASVALPMALYKYVYDYDYD